MDDVQNYSVVKQNDKLFGIMDIKENKYHVMKENGCYDLIDIECFNDCETLYVSELGLEIQVVSKLGELLS